MRANLARVAAYAREHGLAWRPHVKTHKVPALAAQQLAAGACGVTVATLAEAEVMATVADDILLAYPPVGAPKLRRLSSLPADLRLTVGLDSAEALGGLSGALATRRRVGLLVEIDVGMHRVGVQTPQDTVALARVASATRGIDYRGIMFYPGHIRSADTLREEIAALSALLDRYLDALRRAGLEPEVVSGGSTPTLWHSHQVA